jgi:threonine synthase
VQALSGGTGPLAIAKAFRELEPLNILNTLPRQIMVQPDKCAPMAHAWQKAKARGFPDGWENDYPIYENPKTAIPTLSTGDPKTYPVIGKFVKETDGQIIEYDEEKIVDIARLVAFETSVLMGPAAALPVGGLLKSAAEGFIKEGDIVLINIGEGVRRSPDFLENFMDDSEIVKDSGDCSLHDRNALRKKLWEKVTEEFI